MDALERFRFEFRGWVLALNRVKGFDVSPDNALEILESKLPKEMLRQIGGAFINGWLQHEAETTMLIQPTQKAARLISGDSALKKNSKDIAIEEANFHL